MESTTWVQNLDKLEGLGKYNVNKKKNVLSPIIPKLPVI